MTIRSKDAVLRDLGVSRETGAKLEAYVALLERWQKVKNLVGPGTLKEVWSRHIFDSAQLLESLDDRTTLADLGSGAGFPGLVLAILLHDTPGAQVHLVESNGRKAAFLREVVRTLKLPASVHAERIEKMLPHLQGIQAVTARALAPLVDLLSLTNEVLKGPVLGVFPKGQDVEHELTQASKYWTFSVATVASRTDSKARILLIQDVRPASLAESGDHDRGLNPT